MFNPSAYPLVRFCLAFILGILIQECLFPDFNPTWLFFAMVPAAALASVIVHRQLETVWVSGGVILATLIVLGMQFTWLSDEIRSRPNHFSRAPAQQLYCGIVSDLPERTNTGWKYRLKVEHGLIPGQAITSLTGNLQVFLRTDSSYLPPAYGDRLLVKCTPEKIKGPSNPDAFDYAAYMRTHHIHFQAFTKPDSVVLIESNQGSLFWKYTYLARAHVLNTLGRYFTDPADLGVAEALLVGYKGHLPDELQSAYIETGSMHILAVSGAHVGIIFLGLVFLFKRIPIRHKQWRFIETILILLAIWAFAFLAGLGPSIARATVMFSFFLGARAFRLDYDGYNILAASAFVLLLYDPQMLFQVSFQLSFLAVLGMMLFYPALYKLSPVMPAWLDYFWKIVLLGVAAQLGTLPAGLLYFGQFPTWFWLSGLIVVPVASLYMYGAAVLLVTEVFFVGLAKWIAIPLVWMVKSMNYLIYLIQDLPGALLDGIWLRWWEVLLLSAVVALFALHLQRPQGKHILAISALGCFLCASHLYKTWQRHGQREVVFYHSGSSRSLLADFTCGHQRISIAAQTITPKQERFAAYEHRKAIGTLHPLEINSPVWFNAKGPLMQIGNHTIAVLTEPLKYQPTGHKIEVEVLVIDGPAASEADKALEVFNPRQLVLGQNISRSKVLKWKEEAAQKKIMVHSIAQAGAWVWKYNEFI